MRVYICICIHYSNICVLIVYVIRIKKDVGMKYFNCLDCFKIHLIKEKMKDPGRQYRWLQWLEDG